MPETFPPLSPDKPMSLGEHLDELRKRLFYAIVGIVPIFVLGLVFGSKLLGIIAQPLIDALKHEAAGGSMMTTSPLDGFMTVLTIAALLSAILGGPWILYQLWRFIAPGLYAREKRFVYLLGPLSLVLSISGVLFMYYVMLPMALFFFVHFNANLLSRPPTPTVDRSAGLVVPMLPQIHGDIKDPKPGEIWLNTERLAIRIAVSPAKSSTPEDTAGGTPSSAPDNLPKNAPTTSEATILSLPLQSDSFVAQQYKINEYVSLVLWFSLAFAVTFQTPVVVLMLGWAGLVTPEFLKKYRKYVVLICFAIAAVTTPPDAISMLSLAIPMYLLFELGVLMLTLMPARRVARGLGKGTESRDGEGSSTDDPYARSDDQ